MNELDKLASALESGLNQITVDPELARAARLPIERMLNFSAQQQRRVRSSGNIENDMELYQHVGAV